MDEPAAEEGTNGGGDAGQAGPDTDGGALVLGADAGAQNGEASRYQDGGAHALDGAGQHQAESAGDAPAGGGGYGEPRHAGDERPPLAEDISETAPDQKEGAQRQKVRIHRPLKPFQPHVESLLQGGEGDVDGRPIEKRHSRAKSGGQHHPASLGAVKGKAHDGWPSRKPRGMRKCPHHSKKPCTTRARRAAGTAPSSNSPTLSRRMPVRMG